MPDGYDRSNRMEKVKHYLALAIENRNKGRMNEAERNYIDAALSLLSHAKSDDTPSRAKDIRRAIDVLDNFLNVFHPSDTGSGDDYANEGWKILNEVGISASRLEKTSLEDVAGLSTVKEEIMRRLIYPIKYRDLSKKYGVRPSGGVLLYGPPGTGKTFLARAIANEAGAAFINVNPSSLYNQWFGQFEKNITRVFEAARLLSPSVIFFDEIETIASRRGGYEQDAASRRGVSQLLIEMEGVEKTRDEEIFVLAATNRPWDLDEAILRPGRFDIRVYTPLPDASARKKMFENNLRNIAFSDGVDFDDLASKTEGYSGADISYICRRTVIGAFARSVEAGREIRLAGKDMEQTIAEVKPSVSGKTVSLYEKFSGTSGMSA